MQKIVPWILIIIFINMASGFYIQTYNKNQTLYNNESYQPLFQPGYCHSEGDVCEDGQQFTVDMETQQECTPRTKVTFNIDCPRVGCWASSTYINCTNGFTGVNQTKILTAQVSMKSTTNSQHDVNTTYKIILNWIVKPDPTPDPNNDSNLGLILGIIGGVVGAILIVGAGIFFCKKKKKRDDSQLLNEEAPQNDQRK